MNKNLITKAINSTNQECPEFVYTNPLLDRKVARALSKSFVKILNISEQNCKINNNLRMSILENIRRMCTSGPQGHLDIDEELTSSLTDLYQQHTITNTDKTNIDMQLDAFLVQHLMKCDVNSHFHSNLNPEMVQALINLNNNGLYLDKLSKDVIHWNRNGNYTCILRDLWDLNIPDNRIFDNITLKMKPEIEKLLLNICLDIMVDRRDIENRFSNDLNDLIMKCSASPICFQISTGILNFILIMSNFDSQIRIFIPKFIFQVKENVTGSMTSLYPIHLNNLVILMDFDINLLPEALRSRCVAETLKYLHLLHEESENDLILMLSHYPQWFDIYYKESKET